MGIAFRGGGYERFVRFGGRTVKDGEAVAIWNGKGEHTQIMGPRRIWLWYSSVRFLSRHKAEAHEYLRVKYTNGNIECIQGPTFIYENPVHHDEITVHEGIDIPSSEDFIVVMDKGNMNSVRSEFSINKEGVDDMAIQVKEEPSSFTSHSSSRVVRGPALYFPTKYETIHRFIWSNYFSRDFSLSPTQSFQVMTSCKDRLLKISVPIITVDGVEFHPELVFHYHVHSIDRCLAEPDPMHKIFLGLMADIHVLGKQFDSKDLLSRDDDKKTIMNKLNQKLSFPNTCNAAEKVGLPIDSVQMLKIVYSKEFQLTLEREQRTMAKVNAELAEKTLRREHEQMEMHNELVNMQQVMELQRQKNVMEDEAAREEFKRHQAELERRAKLLAQEMELSKMVWEQKDGAVLSFLQGLKKEGVDINAFMCTAGGLVLAKQTLAQSPSLNPSFLRGMQTGDENDPNNKNKSGYSMPIWLSKDGKELSAFSI